jgi:gamma-glutamyltranspeptidase / glutathione hydrolase
VNNQLIPDMRLKNIFGFVACILLMGFLPACRQRDVQAIRSGVVADRAMVVSAHPEASGVGVAVLRDGGNAIDAAVAVHFALAVVYPEAGNIGGGGFLLCRQYDGEVAALDFREKAPAAATRDMFLDSSGRVMENRSLLGHLASGVPGSVAGMVEAHRRYGSMSWTDLLQPAVYLAENGFAVTKRQADRLNENLPDFVGASTMSCSWFQNGHWKEGDILRQPELAATLIRVRDEGNGGFYAGETARLLVEEMRRGGGLITPEDLLSYRALWREPVRGWYKNYHIISMGPPSSGGVALIQMLKMLEHFPELSVTSDKCLRLHLIAEIQKRAFADRAQYLGDADLVPVPVEALLDSGYLARRAAEIRLDRAAHSYELRAGSLPMNRRRPPIFQLWIHRAMRWQSPPPSTIRSARASWWAEQVFS